MGKTQGDHSGWGALAPLCLVAATLVASSPAHAVGPSWLHRLFEPRGAEREPGPPVAHYVMDMGGDFILDRASVHPLLKFDDSPEVWALTVTRGPRGDLIYWNDLRQPLLRITKFGGITVFTPDHPGGSAAAATGPSQPLRLASVGPVGLYQHLALASIRSGRAAQHPISYTAIDADSSSDGLMADAAVVASEAISDIASRPHGGGLLRRVWRVNIVRGAQAQASLREGVMMITIVPALGAFGRPSSLRIEQAVRER